MEHVTIELRQRIQSCNVFILHKIVQIDSSSVDLVQLRFRNTSILVVIDGDKFHIDLPDISIVPESVSILNVAGTWITFRVQTNPVNLSFGTFSAEFLSIGNQDNSTSASSKSQQPPVNTNLILVCQCCKNILTKPNLEFQRVLPLPSDDCDPCEWFCGCSHSHKTDDIDLSNVKMLLSPREYDYLYGSYYCLLANKIFLDQLKTNNEDVVCKRCLSVLGLLNSKNQNTIKFWNYSFEFALTSDLNDYKGKASPLDDFKAAFVSCIKNEYKQVLFTAIEQERKSILLIKLLEKNLQLLVESCESNQTQSSRKKLKKIQVTKVMYKHGKFEIKKSGNIDSDINICRISLRSITAAIEHLVSSSHRIPPVYRQVDNHHVGYIM